jgi:dienelactone hydrolase
MVRNIPEHNESQVKIAAGNASLEGSLIIPNLPKGIVLFVHGSGSSRLSPRNRYVAKIINQAGIATLLFDLLTKEEEEIDTETGEFRFDIPLLARRLLEATSWLKKDASTKKLQIGYFGSSTGAAAALIAAAELPDDIATVVSRGGAQTLRCGISKK